MLALKFVFVPLLFVLLYLLQWPPFFLSISLFFCIYSYAFFLSIFLYVLLYLLQCLRSFYLYVLLYLLNWPSIFLYVILCLLQCLLSNYLSIFLFFCTYFNALSVCLSHSHFCPPIFFFWGGDNFCNESLDNCRWHEEVKTASKHPPLSLNPSLILHSLSLPLSIILPSLIVSHTDIRMRAPVHKNR